MSTAQITVAPAGNVTGKGSKLASQTPDSKSGDDFSRQLQQAEQHQQNSTELAGNNRSRNDIAGHQAGNSAQQSTAPEEAIESEGVPGKALQQSAVQDPVAQQTIAVDPTLQELQPLAINTGNADGSAPLQVIAERLADGETLEITGVQEIPLATDGSEFAVAGAATSALNTTQLPLTTTANLPQSGQVLPSASGLPSRIPLATGREGIAPVAVGTTAAPTVSHSPEVVVAQRPQVDVSANSEFANPFAGQQRPEVAAQKLEPVLPEGLRFSTTLEQPATNSTQSAGLAATGLSAPSAVPGSATGAATLSESAVPRPVISMNTPLGEPGWAQEVGSRLQILVERGNQRAEIRLNPPELGSVEVKVLNDGERTSVTFFAQNGATREALEAAMPRLREMFGESGLQLADANVSQQQSMADDREQAETGNGSTFGTGDGDASSENSESVVVQRANGLVDYYI